MNNTYSNTGINTFQRCPLAFEYQHVLNLHRIGDDSSQHHLKWGAAGHKALEILYRGGTVKDAQQAFRDYYPVQLDPNDLAKTAENGAWAIKQYWDHYNGDRDWEIVACEERGFTEDGFGIKPDLVVRDRNDNLLLVDHKFTGAYLNFDYFSQFDPNSQVTHYIRWAKETYSACDGFVINAIAVRFLKRGSAQRSAGFNVEFERQVFTRTPSQIERTVRATNEVIEDIERAKESGYWRPNETANACKFCTYKSLCSSGWNWSEDQELILNLFRRVCDLPVSATDEHCQLDHGHTGPHSSAIQSSENVEFEVQV